MTEIILLAGAVFCVLSGIFFMQWGIREFGSCSGQARARVVGIYESPVSQDGGYAPIVEFSAGGETVRSRAMTEKNREQEAGALCGGRLAGGPVQSRESPPVYHSGL